MSLPLVDIGYALDCFRFSENIPAEVLIEAVRVIHIIAAGEDYSADTLKTLSENGRMIVRMGVATTISTFTQRSMGIDVANTPGANANAVAEQALM